MIIGAETYGLYKLFTKYDKKKKSNYGGRRLFCIE